MFGVVDYGVVVVSLWEEGHGQQFSALLVYFVSVIVGVWAFPD